MPWKAPPTRYNALTLFSANANRPLAKKIADYLEIPVGDALVGRFPDDEIRVKIQEDVRGADVFVVQPTCAPVNDNLMELLIIIDSLRRASARRITAVIPYYGYARQDRKDEGRVPITAKLVANLITEAGANRVLACDLHAAQIQGFFDIPVDHLTGEPVIIDYFKAMELDDLVVACPDIGSIKMAWSYCTHLNAQLAAVEKRRISPTDTAIHFTIGAPVKGRNVIIVDDMISTAGTIVQAAKLLKEKGALDIFLVATHAVFCGPAVERLQEAPVKEIVVTDTIPLAEPTVNALPNLRVLSVASLLGEAISRIHHHQSVSQLFKDEPGFKR